MTTVYAWDVPSSVTWEECRCLADLAEGRKVLEIGSWMGRSTIALASKAKSVVTVDWHEGDFYAGKEDTLPELKKNLHRYGVNNVEVIVARIEDVAVDLDTDFDLVFVDADHSEESAMAHYLIALYHVREGGLIVFHDYGRFGVTPVLDALDYELEIVGSLAIFREGSRDKREEDCAPSTSNL